MGLVLKHVSCREKLTDISLEIANGKILAMLGPEDGGENEIFKVITGEIPITEGEIIFNGKTVISQAKTETVFEDWVMYKRRMRKALYFLSYRKWLKRVDEKKLTIVSGIMQMDKKLLLSSSHSRISKGERKKLDIARYLITRRDIVLMDTPIIGLDFLACKNILDNIKEIIAQFKQPCLYNAGSEKECEELKGKVAIVKNGMIEYYGDWNPSLHEEGL